jgi:tripartite-type tricarboxylate transporter receptor subunit TctC
MKKRLFVMGLLIAMLSISVFANGTSESGTATGGADEYPVKKVTFICPSAAGGAMDSNTRFLAPYLDKYLSAKVDVVNMGGSACWIGWKYMCDQKKDGSFISYANFPNMITGYLDPQATLNMDRSSFEFIALYTSDMNVIMANKEESRFSTGKEFFEYANNNVVTIGDAGARTDDAVAIALLEQKLGFKFQHVHFQNSAEGFAALLGGHIDILMGNVSEAVNKGVEVKSILVLSEKRSSYLPNVETTYENGIKVENASSRGVVASKGLDPKAKELLIAASKEAMEDSEQLAGAQKQGINVTPMYGDDFAKWAETQETNIKGIYSLLDN